MNERHFPNFIDAYVDYALDDFCPERFHEWTAISLIAAALERKVTLDQPVGQTFIRHYPNLYVMLVCPPGGGKSTAINRGEKLIMHLKNKVNPNFKLLPQSMNSESIIEEMHLRDSFYLDVGGKRLEVFHSSGYFLADEASDSALQNTHGDFIARMTKFFDCPDRFEKVTVSKGKKEIENSCMNMLCGSTFNYLRELVNDSSVLGGFASRVIYVVSKDKRIRDVKWLKDKSSVNYEFYQALCQDLEKIHTLRGPMTPTNEFIELFLDWFPEFEQERVNLNSEKYESLFARKGTNLIKLAMVCSVAESNSLEIKAEHFHRARKILDRASKDNEFVLRQSIMQQKDTQLGLNEAIKQFFEQQPEGMTVRELADYLIDHGNDVSKIKTTINYMKENKLLIANGDGRLHFSQNDD